MLWTIEPRYNKHKTRLKKMLLYLNYTICLSMAQCRKHLANSTDNKLMIVLLFSQENKFWQFIRIVFQRIKCQSLLTNCTWKNDKKKYFNVICWFLLPSMQSIASSNVSHTKWNCVFSECWQCRPVRSYTWQQMFTHQVAVIIAYTLNIWTK